MPVNADNLNTLALYGISLKKELKAASILQLNGYNDDIRMSRQLYDKLLFAIKNSISNSIKLPQTTFGIELEFVGSCYSKDINAFNNAMSKLLPDKYFCALSYTHNNGNSWILGRDGSIKLNSTNIKIPYGYELSSPKLNLFDDSDMNTVATVIEYCRTFLHAETNQSCGTHIHIGFKHDGLFRGSICNILSAYSFMEKTVFDPIVPTSRRRNRYCKPTKPWPDSKYQKLSSRFCEFSWDGKCKALHFEFRQLEGTLDINTIVYWANLQAYILYDLLDHIDNNSYIQTIMKKNIFELLFRYEFDSKLISFFIRRVIEFRSRTLIQVDDLNKGILYISAAS